MSRRLRLFLALALTALFTVAAHAQHPTTRPPAIAPSAPSAPLIDLNAASADELESLPGIGPTRAHAIVEHRAAHPFKKVDELTKVKGIGRKTFARLRPLVTLGGARR